MLYGYLILAGLSLSLLIVGQVRERGAKKGIGYGAGRLLYQFWKRLDVGAEQRAAQYRKIQIAAQRELIQQEEEREISFWRAAVLLFLGVQLAGALYCWSTAQQPQRIVLARDECGGEEQDYALFATLPDGSEEKVTVTVAARQYRDEELEALFEEGFAEAWKRLLADNASQERITSALCPVSQLAAGPLSVRWDWEEDVILDTGELCRDKIQDRTAVTVSLELQYEQEVRRQSRVLYVMPPVTSEREQLLQTVREGLIQCEQADPNAAEIVVPSEWDGVVLRMDDSDYRFYFLLLSALLPLLLWGKRTQNLREALEHRQRQLLQDYPELIHKLVLYMGAGMPIQQCFAVLYREYRSGAEENGKRYLYEEIGAMLQELRAGASQRDCYARWARRLDEPVYSKLVQLLIQNLYRGTQGVLSLLQQELQQALLTKRESARRYGEEAGTRLLFPMLLLLLVALVIVMAPALLQLSEA